MSLDIATDTGFRLSSGERRHSSHAHGVFVFSCSLDVTKREPLPSERDASGRPRFPGGALTWHCDRCYRGQSQDVKCGVGAGDKLQALMSQRHMLGAVFRMIDINGDGMLSRREVAMGVETLNGHLPDEDKVRYCVLLTQGMHRQWRPVDSVADRVVHLVRVAMS